jgi:alpha-1,3-rhamnosyl/mannosyltransferase
LTVSLAARTSVRVIVPSAATRADLVSLLHVPGEKITVVPLAVDTRFAPQATTEIARVRAKYSLPEKYILSVAINKPHKNLATLIDAWRALSDSECALIIAGAWDARYVLRSMPGENRQLGIRFLHNLPDDDLPALYAGAAVFVFPSLYEGFGLPPLEAMACGAPVVCSNAASLPEVAGDAALLVNPRDAGEIVAALRRILSDVSLREQLRGKSLVRAAQFSWARAARETLRVYQDIVGRS